MMLMVREKSLVIYVRIVFNRAEIYDPNYYYRRLAGEMRILIVAKICD